MFRSVNSLNSYSQHFPFTCTTRRILQQSKTTNSFSIHYYTTTTNKNYLRIRSTSKILAFTKFNRKFYDFTRAKDIFESLDKSGECAMGDLNYKSS